MEHKMYFSEEQIEQLQDEYDMIQGEYAKFLDAFVLKRSYEEKEAEEFAVHGFSRRIGIMKRCIDNIYRICPPEINRKPSSEELGDIIINLHTFIINIYASLDNLAWVWIKEREIIDKEGNPLSRHEIGLSKKHKTVRRTFSKEFQSYLKTLDQWFSYIKNFRDALAHRIPLYVPPYTLNDEEAEKEKELESLRWKALMEWQNEEYERLSAEIESLGRFSPWMTHSFGEGSRHVVFHYQIITDWKLILEISKKFIEELDREVN